VDVLQCETCNAVGNCSTCTFGYRLELDLSCTKVTTTTQAMTTITPAANTTQESVIARPAGSDPDSTGTGTSDNVVAIAVGVSCGILILVLIFLAVVYVRSHGRSGDAAGKGYASSSGIKVPSGPAPPLPASATASAAASSPPRSENAYSSSRTSASTDVYGTYANPDGEPVPDMYGYLLFRKGKTAPTRWSNASQSPTRDLHDDVGDGSAHGISRDRIQSISV